MTATAARRLQGTAANRLTMLFGASRPLIGETIHASGHAVDRPDSCGAKQEPGGQPLPMC